MMWLVNDRANDVPLYSGDEVVIFNAGYMPEELYRRPVVGGNVADPYQRLTMDPDHEDNATRYVKWRAGEWDVWQIEKV